MHSNFKNIHIGLLIRERLKEFPVEMSRICNFMKCDEKYIEQEIFEKEYVSTDVLLRISKLLEYDFFRLYSQHLILYAPPARAQHVTNKEKLFLPRFRKSMYSKELIDFILEMIERGDKTKSQVIKEYGIPKTTLFKWISKYSSNEQGNTSVSVSHRDE